MFDNFKCRLENIRVCGQVWSCEVSLPSTAGRQRSGSTQEEAQKFSPRDQNRGDRCAGCTCILSTMCATHGARAGDTTWVTRSVHDQRMGPEREMMMMMTTMMLLMNRRRPRVAGCVKHEKNQWPYTPALRMSSRGFFFLSCWSTWLASVLCSLHFTVFKHKLSSLIGLLAFLDWEMGFSCQEWHFCKFSCLAQHVRLKQIKTNRDKKKEGDKKRNQENGTKRKEKRGGTKRHNVI